MSGLIVNFPAQRGMNQAKSVRFSSTGTLREFARSTESENKMKWYCKEDYARFCQDRNEDIVECSMILMNKGVKALSTEDLCYFTGLETFLSPNVPKRIQKIRNARFMHVAAVLVEQMRQRRMNIYSQEAIANVSRKSSYQARVRAYKIAVAAATL
jgi:hypothetical protein